jgi:hypothetical protein
MFDNTWYHKFSQSWHMATEAWYMYERDVPSVSGPIEPEKGTNGAFCSTGQVRCLAPEWAMVPKQCGSSQVEPAGKANALVEAIDLASHQQCYRCIPPLRIAHFPKVGRAFQFPENL